MSRYDPRIAVRRLFSDTWGYDVSKDEDQAVKATGGSSTYGEIMPTALDRLIESLDPEPEDVFFDLGSGLGKVILQVAMTVELRQCIGIELVESRHRAAMAALARARAAGYLETEDVRFRKADILRARLTGATILYTCSTAFPEGFMMRVAERVAGLREGVRLVTLQELDENPWFDTEEVLRLDMSWKRRTKVHVYRLTRSRRC